MSARHCADPWRAWIDPHGNVFVKQESEMNALLMASYASAETWFEDASLAAVTGLVKSAFRAKERAELES